ncbi:MAG: prepilin-type N-terminal cleavage/methylation domain-containing protein [Firmicutes bacterium]|nr:prepilin-type N-terminal cleavage/methylation domain-containing protein [Bacillota bacterium]
MFVKPENNKGFTLVELLTVVAIIAILVAVVAPNLFRAIEKSKVTAVVADYMNIKTATLAYYSDTGNWPVGNSGDNSDTDPGFVKQNPNVDNWNGPYLESWPVKNPWGKNYVFVEENDLFGPARCLRVDGVPETAAESLQEQLGETNVKTKKNGVDYVYLLIAKD